MKKRREEHPGARYLERRVVQQGIKPRFAASLIAIGWLIAIVVFGIVEHLVDRDNFEDVWEGMWWATQTVTTVGYGDSVPNNAPGQLIAAVLMIGGLSLFAVVTGTVTSAFVARAQAELDASGSGRDAVLIERLDRLSAELEAVREQLDGRDRPSGEGRDRGG